MFEKSKDREWALCAYPFHFNDDHMFCFNSCPHSKYQSVSDLVSSLSAKVKSDFGDELLNNFSG